MVKGSQSEHIYEHPWERVTTANWRKYTHESGATTPLKHIMNVETVDRHLDSDEGRLYSKRIITIGVPGLDWLKGLMGARVCHCVENSVVDARVRSMELITRNITLRDYVEYEEKVTYRPHPENADWTVSTTETQVNCKPLRSGMAMLADRLERGLAERMSSSSVRGREIMEQVCRFMKAEATHAVAGIVSSSPPVRQ